MQFKGLHVTCQGRQCADTCCRTQMGASRLFLKDNPCHWVEHISMLSLHLTKKLPLSRYLYRGESSTERMSSSFACQHLPNICSSITFMFAGWTMLSTWAWSSKHIRLYVAGWSSMSSQSNSVDFKAMVLCFSTYRLELSKEFWNLREQHINIREHRSVASRNPFSTHFSSFLYLTL